MGKGAMNSRIEGDFPQEIEATERKRQEAMLAGDLKVLASILHDDLIWIHSNGKAHGKSGFLGTIQPFGPVDYKDFLLAVHSTFRLGHDAWLINGRLQSNTLIAGRPQKIDAIFIATWLRDEQGWRLTSWQSTPWHQG